MTVFYEVIFSYFMKAMKKKLDVIMAAVLIAGSIGVYFLLQNNKKEIMKEAVNTVAAKGHIIVIDAGHGGNDPGKVGINGEFEKNINLAISLKLQKCFENLGYTVVMTRTEDKGLYSDNAINKKAEDLKKRCEIVEQSGAELVISIHQNSFQDYRVAGAQVFYYEHSDKGKYLAEQYQKLLREYVDTNNTRTPKPNDSYYLLLHTPCPAVIVECGFLSNEDEAFLLNQDYYQERICKALVSGTEVYFNN